MANFNNKNSFELKALVKMSVFNTFLVKISKLYKTKADMCTKLVHAGLAIFVTDAKAAPVYVRASQGNHPGQRRIQR